MLILALVEHRPGHGYEISQVIETRPDGAVRFRVASLYPCSIASKRGWILGSSRRYRIAEPDHA